MLFGDSWEMKILMRISTYLGPRGGHFSPARPSLFLGRVLGRKFRPPGRARPAQFFWLWAGFWQAKNDFLVYFLVRPVLARKNPLI